MQYYMEAGGFGKKTAEAAGAVLDRIRNGEVSWKDLSNIDISALYSVFLPYILSFCLIFCLGIYNSSQYCYNNRNDTDS